MKIVVIGGGPAGLYFALLIKKARPDWNIVLHERNQPEDTFGFGVVFSDETLSSFAIADADSYAQITKNFAYWDAIDIHFQDQTVRSHGHGFCGLARKTLLHILQQRAATLGVKLHFGSEVDPALDQFADADLIVAADGINSAIRERHSVDFQPTIDWRANRFVWLGTTKPLETFTFIFRANEHGLFQVHAYPFESGTSTWIVEASEETWKRAGLDQADEAATVAYCERLFAANLDGHQLLTNRSIWRSFPTIKCKRWVHKNIALLGDAAHTAHFSIGSGTKLAMEDAIALAQACLDHSAIPEILQGYEQARYEDVARLQTAAQTSLEWFEQTSRYQCMTPVQFAMSLMSRSKRVTYDNLRLRDPGFIAAIDQWFAEQVQSQVATVIAEEPIPPPMFQPFRLRDLQLTNRVVVSPMCQYSAEDGLPNDWHLVHLGSRAIGGAGLIVTEMTDIAPDARITKGCAGLWSQAHAQAWARITSFVHDNSSAKICVQLAHAGRKGATCIPWSGGYDEPLSDQEWPILAPSPLPYFDHSQIPREMSRADMDRVVADFIAATKLAELAGFDMVELHMAHGYLLSSFISPLTNQRQDVYGGALTNRLRFPLEVFDAMRAVWPTTRPMSVRLSATDWVEESGLTPADAVAIARVLKAHGCDLIDVSAGQTVPYAKPIYGRMFQTPFADQIRWEAGIATMAVGNITSADQVNTILAAGRADLVALARPHLSDPYFTLHAAAHYGYKNQSWPKQYAAGRDQAFALAARANQEALAADQPMKKPKSFRPRQAAE